MYLNQDFKTANRQKKIKEMIKHNLDSRKICNKLIYKKPKSSVFVYTNPLLYPKKIS